ncbi:helix-turn-helix domain-containing protein [Actinomadura keratinilytica]|uniref:HTH marR-type domain-containing protein n=1 Tax=Actinomadura keratinilytica TaxID=547461 RepID=A0ABP7Z9W4_9ACTN
MGATDALGGRNRTFLTDHARVLIHIARNPQARIRDIAAGIGITERATQLIINDLEEAGYLTRARVGRRNTYTINPDRPFRHPAEGDHHINALITLFTGHDETLGGHGGARSARPAPSSPAREQATPDEH